MSYFLSKSVFPGFLDRYEWYQTEESMNIFVLLFTTPVQNFSVSIGKLGSKRSRTKSYNASWDEVLVRDHWPRISTMPGRNRMPGMISWPFCGALCGGIVLAGRLQCTALSDSRELDTDATDCRCCVRRWQRIDGIPTVPTVHVIMFRLKQSNWEWRRKIGIRYPYQHPERAREMVYIADVTEENRKKTVQPKMVVSILCSSVVIRGLRVRAKFTD